MTWYLSLVWGIFVMKLAWNWAQLPWIQPGIWYRVLLYEPWCLEVGWRGPCLCVQIISSWKNGIDYGYSNYAGCIFSWWKSCNEMYILYLNVIIIPRNTERVLIGTSGNTVTKPISYITLFSLFCSSIETLVTYWISHPYLTGVAAASMWPPFWLY